MIEVSSAERQHRTRTERKSTAPVTLSVIFPAFNEEANIRNTVEAARMVLPKLAETWEIILVNDGSRDATTPICDELAAQYPEVRAIHHVENRGYGAALKSGILAARFDYIFFTDSDGQFDLQELENLIDWASHYEIVTGYRAKRQDPPRQNAEPVNSRDSRKITLLVAGNPKHGKAKARFALYRDGMTVAAYRAAVGERQGSADIRWDARKNYIRIE